MQISLKWINEIVNIEAVELNELIEKLTFGGFEVEEVLEVEIDKVKEISLDISATANRSDSLSIQGISREIAALLNKSTNSSAYLTESDELKQKISRYAFVLPENLDYSFLSSVIIENLTNLTVPKWIKKKLICSGIIPSNSLADFQSYILLETGYPFAFYDFDKVSTKLNTKIFNLTVSNAKTNQQFIASNNEEYTLDDSILLIEANKIPISIAGIIENKEFTCSKKTTSIIIEASIFNAAKIRQQSRNLGVRTDRSTRYEKSLRNTYLIESLYRLISLLRISNPNLVVKLQTITKASEQVSEPILLNYKTTQEILGPIKKLSNIDDEYISHEMIEDYLHRLNFTVIYEATSQTWEVTVPHSRREDITREIDLIEEIGRLHGFNNFLITLPELKTIGIEDTSYKIRKKITSCLLNLGLNELIHYSLVNEKTFLTNEIELVNPLVSEYSNLRFSLLPNLIKTVQENLKQSNSVINGFEHGHVFLRDKNNQFKEKDHVAGIFGGLKKKLSWSDSERELTWFEAKGRIEQLFNQLSLPTKWHNNSLNTLNEIIHNYRSAEIYSNSGTKIGVFGQIHPILANNLNLSPEIYLFEFDIEVIQTQIQTNNLSVYKEYSLYPKIIKDVSFIVKENIEFKDLQEILYLNGTQFLSEVNLLDEYKGDSIPNEHISLCLQLIFQSNKKTLQNKEIEAILDNIRLILTQEFNATIRN